MHFFEERRVANFREVELSPQNSQQSIVNGQQKKVTTAPINKVDDKEAKQLKNKISKLEEEIGYQRI
jgi:hypothetical protein